MQHDISITVVNNTVGIPTSSDGVMGLVVQTEAIGSTFVLNTPYLLTQLSDATALGITATTDSTDGVALFQHINEFYLQAGSGALLWIYGISTATTFATFVASAAFDNFIAFTGTATPANRVKMVGLCYAVPTTLQSATDFPADVPATLTAFQTKQQTLFARGLMISGILDGANMSSTVTPATIGTEATNSAFSISLCVTGTQGNGVSSVGLALGRFARISVGHGFGAISDGPVNAASAYLTNSIWETTASTLTIGDVITVAGPAGATVTYNSVTYAVGQTFTVLSGHLSFTASGGGYGIDNATPVSSLPSLSSAYIDQLGSKQFMFLRTWQDYSGYYWNDGATCTASTQQLSTQEYNRVANKLSANAKFFFTAPMGTNLPLNPATGAVDSTWLNAKQAEFQAAYIDPIAVGTGTGDVSAGSITVTGPNFNATKTLNFTLMIVPTPIMGGVIGTVQFTSTL